MNHQRALESIFKGRGIKEFWEGAPKQPTILEWFRKGIADSQKRVITFSPSDLPDTPLELL